MYFRFAAAAIALLCGASVQADTRPDSHAPISVMGDHLHKAGEWMFSYRFMQMSMKGNQDGTSSISPDEIATTVSNRFANPPMMPPTLRVVPTSMDMKMHMIGVMYAPSDRITLMGMMNYLDNEMDHITYAGPTGTAQLGTFTTGSSGIGDTTFSALVRLWVADGDQLHATMGLSLPTGSTDETAEVLSPMNTRPTLRMPYPMQLGSGTFDPILGLTWTRTGDRFSGGAQWRSTLRVADNDDDYRLGDEHRLTGWLSYLASDRTSFSARVGLVERGTIDGMDPNIMAPVQTADPDRYGFTRWEFSLGANFLLPGERNRLALEFIAPVSQDLNGPQLETDWQVVLGWQFAP